MLRGRREVVVLAEREWHPFFHQTGTVVAARTRLRHERLHSMPNQHVSGQWKDRGAQRSDALEERRSRTTAATCSANSAVDARPPRSRVTRFCSAMTD